jgi:hypothetical protein
MCFGAAVPAFAKDWHRGREQRPEERYVPANGDIIDILFGGPRYYDNRMFTTAAGPCAYHPVGPDANAVNDINDRYCGK